MRAQRFESLGARPFYGAVAKIVREPLLPSTTDPLGEWTASKLDATKTKARYFGAANFARAACYIPQAIAFWIGHYWPGLTYVLVIWALHLILVYVEAYKRSLAEHWLDSAPDREDDTPPPSAERPPKPFHLYPFETEAFYRRIGLEWFRLFSTWVMSTLTYGWNSERMTFITQPSRQQVIAFERETRVSEAVHWISALSVAPLVVFSWLGSPLGVALWSSVIVLGDVLLALLQRYHRSRVWPIIKRKLERKA